VRSPRWRRSLRPGFSVGMTFSDTSVSFVSTYQDPFPLSPISFFFVFPSPSSPSAISSPPPFPILSSHLHSLLPVVLSFFYPSQPPRRTDKPRLLLSLWGSFLALFFFWMLFLNLLSCFSFFFSRLAFFLCRFERAVSFLCASPVFTISCLEFSFRQLLAAVFPFCLLNRNSFFFRREEPAPQREVNFPPRVPMARSYRLLPFFEENLWSSVTNRVQTLLPLFPRRTTS